MIVKQAVPSEADVIDTARYTAHGRRPLSTPSANTHTHTHTHATETGTVFTGRPGSAAASDKEPPAADPCRSVPLCCRTSHGLSGGFFHSGPEGPRASVPVISAVHWLKTLLKTSADRGRGAQKATPWVGRSTGQVSRPPASQRSRSTRGRDPVASGGGQAEGGGGEEHQVIAACGASAQGMGRGAGQNSIATSSP